MNIQHQPERQRFIARLDNHSVEAKITYRLLAENQIDFNHTFVPPEFRGHGVAAELLEVAALWAQQQGYVIQASCRYAYIKLKRMELI